MSPEQKPRREELLDRLPQLKSFLESDDPRTWLLEFAQDETVPNDSKLSVIISTLVLHSTSMGIFSEDQVLAAASVKLMLQVGESMEGMGDIDVFLDEVIYEVVDEFSAAGALNEHTFLYHTDSIHDWLIGAVFSGSYVLGNFDNPDSTKKENLGSSITDFLEGLNVQDF